MFLYPLIVLTLSSVAFVTFLVIVYCNRRIEPDEVLLVTRRTFPGASLFGARRRVGRGPGRILAFPFIHRIDRLEDGPRSFPVPLASSPGGPGRNASVRLRIDDGIEAPYRVLALREGGPSSIESSLEEAIQAAAREFRPEGAVEVPGARSGDLARVLRDPVQKLGFRIETLRVPPPPDPEK